MTRPPAQPLSPRSLRNLATCHPDLQALFTEVNKNFPCEVIEGHRNQEDQDRYFKEGKSKLPWPRGEHNKLPSHAADVLPRPIDWSNKEQMIMFVGYVLATADQLGIRVRSGYDWDRDFDLKDEKGKLRDLPHFELI